MSGCPGTVVIPTTTELIINLKGALVVLIESSSLSLKLLVRLNDQNKWLGLPVDSLKFIIDHLLDSSW